jgi:predicted DNA-binding protein with PD1-like motif
METIARGTLSKVVYAHLSPGEDLYRAILDVAEQEGIKTGLVLSITGGLAKVRLSMPMEAESVESPPGILELDGTAEASGHGLIGQTLDSWSSPRSGIENVEGQPYLHVHVTATVAGHTYCGHLIDGCIVRSMHEKSHFTIALAAVEGVQLNFRVSQETMDTYPQGIPYHEVLEG